MWRPLQGSSWAWSAMTKRYIRSPSMTTSRRLLKQIQALVLVCAALLCACPRSLSAEDRMKGPTTRAARSTSPAVESATLPARLGMGAILLFSKVISPADGPRSPSFPTGSAYALDAFRKHGFLLGTILTADRLLHESDIHTGLRVSMHGIARYYDPVEHNTYWWQGD